VSGLRTPSPSARHDPALHPDPGDGRVALSVEGVSKRFGAVVANDNVDLSIDRGEVRGLVGENGAGKTTLTSIVAGVYVPDAGRVVVDGAHHRFLTPSDALRAGISIVHQHPMLVENQTVTQNVALVASRRRRRFDRQAIEAELRRLADEYGLAVDPRSIVGQLSPPEQQRVEILLALHARSNIIILDEPTAILPPGDVTSLIETVKRLGAQGKAVIFISHKLEEVLELADTITVMRAGAVVETVDRADADADILARLMVGGDVPEIRVRSPSARGAVALRVSEVEVASEARSVEVRGASLRVSAGEILGVAGVDGNGQPELMDAIAGLRAVTAGRIELLGGDVTRLSVEERAGRGLAHVPEDRRGQGLALSMSVAWNIGLRHFQTTGGSRWSVDYRALRDLASELIEAFDIRGATVDTPVGDLSGGNQQKVMLARELSTQPKALLASNPTAGLDVGAAAFVHERLLTTRDQGCAIVVVSPDLDELMLLSDRLVVMYRGTTVGATMERPFSRHRLGLLMGGVQTGGSAATEFES